MKTKEDIEKNEVRYIKDKWLNKPFDYIAIKCKGKWLFYQLFEQDCMEDKGKHQG